MVNDKLEEKRKHGNFLLPLGIYDVDLGDKEYSISAHWHKEIEIILVNTGEFNLQINSDFYTCKCGDIVIINCEELHYLIAKENVYSEFTSLVFDISQLNSSILDSSSVNFITPIVNKKFKLPTVINENFSIYNNLKENIISDTDYRDGYVKGTINVSNEKNLLYTSIPYDEGWSVTVDGKKVDYLNILNGLIGIELDEGEHIIEFKYRVSGLIIGSIISILGLISFLGYGLKGSFTRKRRFDHLFDSNYLRRTM